MGGSNLWPKERPRVGRQLLCCPLGHRKQHQHHWPILKMSMTQIDIDTPYWWLKSIFSEMILATLARIRATNRNVNRLFLCLNLRIRRWELHHKNRLVALFTNIKVRRPNSLVLTGKCRVWCEVHGFWKVFRAFLGPNFGFGGWDFARIEIF